MNAPTHTHHNATCCWTRTPNSTSQSPTTVKPTLPSCWRLNSVVPQAVISHRSLRSQCEHLVSVCICFTTILLKSINSIVSLELFNQPLPKRQHWHVLESWLNLNQIVLKQSPLHHPHARDEAGAKACSQVQPQAGKQKQHTLIVYEIVCMIAQVHKRNLWSKLVNEIVWMHNVSQVHKMNQLSVHEGQTDQHQSCQAH